MQKTPERTIEGNWYRDELPITISDSWGRSIYRINIINTWNIQVLSIMKGVRFCYNAC